MNFNARKIMVVTIGSIAISIAVILIAIVASFPLGLEKKTIEIFFEEWPIISKLIISACVFPILWRYMKVSN